MQALQQQLEAHSAADENVASAALSGKQALLGSASAAAAGCSAGDGSGSHLAVDCAHHCIP